MTTPALKNCFVGLLLAFLLSLLLGMGALEIQQFRKRSALRTQVAAYYLQNTLIAESVQQTVQAHSPSAIKVTSVALGVSPTPPPTSTSPARKLTLSPTPSPTATPLATASPSPTPSTQPSATPTQTGSPTPPATARLLLQPNLTPTTQGPACTSRFVRLSADYANALLGAQDPISIEINRLSGTKVLRSWTLKDELPFKVLDFLGLIDADYFVQVDAERFTAVDLTFQLNLNCPVDTLEISYRLEEGFSLLDREPSRDPFLALDWRMLSWQTEAGAEGETRWSAVLALIPKGGFNHIYRQMDESGSFQVLPAPQVTLRAPACQPAHAVVQLIAGQRTVTREIILQAPYCP